MHRRLGVKRKNHASALGTLGDPPRTVMVKGYILVCRLHLTRFKMERTNIDSPVCLLNVANRKEAESLASIQALSSHHDDPVHDYASASSK